MAPPVSQRAVVLPVLVCAALLLQPSCGAAETLFTAAGGLGFDGETAEEAPVRCLAAVGVVLGALETALSLETGLPWEPAASWDTRLTALDADLVRLAGLGGAWVRAVGTTAVEAGWRAGLALELGPRPLCLAAAAGGGRLSTWYAAPGTWLGDGSPWAHLGIACRPADGLRVELSMASDGTAAYWLRTVFALSGAWEPAPGFRLDGLLALHYSDFFTLTSYLDGFEARASWRMPVGRLP